MRGKGNSGVSPVIGMILIVAITVVMAAVVGVTVLGFGDAVSGGKTIGVVPHTTGDDTKPLQLTFWGEDLVKMKGVQVAVATAGGVRIGTPVNNLTVFSDGVPVLIEFEEGFDEGYYPMVITATFDDKTEQVIYTGKMRVGAKWKTPQEVSDRARIAISCDVMNYRLNITDKSTYVEEYPVKKWTLDYDDGTPIKEYSPLEYPKDTKLFLHDYPKLNAILSEKSYNVTFTVYYEDDKCTSVTEEVTTYLSIEDEGIRKYLKVFKFQTKYLLKDGEDPENNMDTFMDLRFVNTVTIWRESLPKQGVQVTIARNIDTRYNYWMDVDGWYFYDDEDKDKENPTDSPTGITVLANAKPGDVRSITVAPYNNTAGILMTHTVTITIR
ncbi:hypothetical protein McpAg1_17190 [Methanocorpusculaceae archaeon Ag1]|uniref:Archaeal Type IV pilin N-terminal domain-containing protein n=2 Tax=Methanorbis furvi TaxID=3028299 RepID=A0AAE4SCF7_9EURY|nr:hypothetical protein [Methanocorpusculaceae archaeon Ag1]